MRAQSLIVILLLCVVVAPACVSDSIRRGRSTAEVTRTPRRGDGTRGRPAEPSEAEPEQTTPPGRRDAGVTRAEASRADASGAAEMDAGVPIEVPPEVVTPPAADVRHQLRLAIDDHTGAILGCLGSHAGALDLSWTVEGVFTVSLRPPHRAGEDVAREEECVAVALRDLTLPAHAAAGSLIHAIEAP